MAAVAVEAGVDSLPVDSIRALRSRRELLLLVVVVVLVVAEVALRLCHHSFRVSLVCGNELNKVDFFAGN